MDNKKDFLQTIKDLFSKAVSKFRELRDMLEAKLGARRLRIIAVSVTAFIVLLILMISLPAGLFGAESKSSSSKDNNELDNVYPDLLPEPYDPDEYPAWTKKLRRATVVFVGSYPLSVFFTKLGIDLYDWGYHGFSSEYSPAILGGGGDKSRKMTTRNCCKTSMTGGI